MKTQLDWDNIKLNLLTLTFSGDIEREFGRNYFDKSVRHIRVAMVLALFFFSAFGVLDAWIVPEVKHQLWFIRYGLFCPFLLAILAFSFTAHFQKYNQLSIAAVVLGAGLGIVAMTVIAPGSNTYYTGIILVFMFGYTFFKLRFIYAATAGLMIVGAYEIAAIFLTPTPIHILINNNFFFIAGNLIGMFACYSIELYSRKDFMQAHLLEREKKKVKKANRELGHKVAERTAQLVKANDVLRQQMAERKLAQERLRNSRERYKNILETMEEGYYEYNKSGNLRFCNDSFTRITGYDHEELIDKHYRVITHPEDVSKVFRIFNDVYISRKASKGFAWRIRTKDGNYRHLEASALQVTNAEGLPDGFRGLVRDVSDRFRTDVCLEASH